MPIVRVNADSPALPSMSRNLELSLHRALVLANQRLHENTTLEHLLLALIDDEDAAPVMRAGNVDPEKLNRDLAAYVESEAENPVSDGNQDSKPTADFHRVIERAATHVRSSRQDEVTGADVLVAIIDERESHAAYLLRGQGMTHYDATRFISHKIAKEVSHNSAFAKEPGPRSASDKLPGLLAKVQLLNDDYTPMEFVVQVLERTFAKDRETATRIMFEIHNKGVGTCGIYPYDIADAKLAEVLDCARQHQHPLQCVLEPSSPAERCP
jgi:ATP-dependent Clp protease adapter protein ClpS